MKTMNNNFFTTNKKFSKNDILIKNYIINHILDTKERNLILHKNELQKILILGSYDDIFEILNKFKDKYYILILTTFMVVLIFLMDFMLKMRFINFIFLIFSIT